MTRSITMVDLNTLLDPKWSVNALTYTFIGPSNRAYYADKNLLQKVFTKTPFATPADIENVSHTNNLQSAFNNAAQAWMAVANITLTQTGPTDPVGTLLLV